MEATNAEEANDPARRFTFDRSLLAALVDRWRPETHTFHLPCGEMAPTLHDVSYLFGLPIAGDAVCAPDVPVTWREDILARFAGVVRRPGLPAYRPFGGSDKHGPPKKWLLQFQVIVSFMILFLVILTLKYI